MVANSFQSNPLLTRSDVIAACISLLDPLAAGTSPSGALITCGATATHYDERAAQLEGFARPLWGLASLLAGGNEYGGAERWVRGLSAGTDPESAEYWGAMRNRDQRMVEACPIGYALMAANGEFWGRLSAEEKGKVERWLRGINEKDMPQTNWLWFRIFANLGLQKSSVSFSQTQIDADLKQLDTFYRGGGWSNDGPEGFTQMDYYSGSFAIQTLQLLWLKHAGSQDPDRAKRYTEQAQKYAIDFIHYFDSSGRAITFGRSLTYRFAMVAFWAAFAAAEIEPPSPLSRGIIKGVLLRNLRWWTQQKGIFQPNGMLSIGYTYPNMHMTENYNSPGSPYWCMLAFLPLALGKDSPFWTAQEEPYPVNALPAVRPLNYPLHITVHRAGHTFILSSGQMCHYPMKASAAKYGKFAYSSAFGYSVPTGDYTLELYAPDNVLALSDDGGETWKVRRRTEEARIDIYDDEPVLVSKWRPWPDVVVETYLVPPTKTSEGWHVRIHKITTNRRLKTAEGGFAIYGQNHTDGRALEILQSPKPATEGLIVDQYDANVVSRKAGVSGIYNMSPSARQRPEILRADANSNIVDARTVIPILKGEIAEGEHVFVTGVFAMPADEDGRWLRKEAWVTEWVAPPVIPGGLEERVREWTQGGEMKKRCDTLTPRLKEYMAALNP